MKLIDPIIAVLIFQSVAMQHELPQIEQVSNQPAQEVIHTLLSQQFFAFSTHVIGNDYSVGFTFQPQVSGEVSELRLLIPNEGTYTVSLWDIDNQTLLVQDSITQVVDEWTAISIPTQQLQANRTYALTVLLPIGTQYYNVSELELPASVGGVNVLNSIAAYGDSYPVELQINDALFGLVDFTFTASTKDTLTSLF